MLSGKKIVAVLVIAMAMSSVQAQSQEDEIAAEMRRTAAQLEKQEAKMAAQRREAEMQMEQAARQMEQAVRQREAASNSNAGRIEFEVRMREAEQALASAAQQMSQLSMRQLPRVAMVERIVRANQGPLLGVNIAPSSNDDPVEGVNIMAVSPGGAAAEAGLRGGDTITSINGESLTADSGRLASEKLLDFMRGVEVGDELTVEYLRNGKSETVEVIPRPMGVHSFSFEFDNDFNVPQVHVAPNVSMNRFLWVTQSGGFGDMELVKLTDELGSYFGTAEGLLVVRAPENEELKLKDGDVIQSIDGREPTSASHAMRILGSYESGETVKIEIMRDKRRQTVSIEVPDNAPGAIPPVPPVAPAVQVYPQGAVIDLVEEAI